MTTVVADNLLVCTDCVQMIANAEGTPEHLMEMAAQWGEDLIGMVLACPEGCEGEFSTRPCEGCGSTLGGDRHPAAVLR